MIKKLIITACIFCVCLPLHAAPEVPSIFPAQYVDSSKFGISINCNARPMLTMDTMRIWRFTGDITLEIRPNPLAPTAVGIGAFGDIGESDDSYFGPYLQYSFEHNATEGGFCGGWRFGR